MDCLVKLCSCYLAVMIAATLSVPSMIGQPQNSTQPSGSPFHKLRSISGAAGHEEKGRFLMGDARSAFTSGKDTKVIVYFEWEGPLGPHHFEGLWKSPEGKIVLISDFKYEAKTPTDVK